MKLFVAISGKDRNDVLARLQKALDNPREFGRVPPHEDNAYSPEYDEDGNLVYQLDWEWTEGDGDAMLAELLDNEEDD